LLNHATDPDGDTLSFTLITGVGTITENTYIYSPDYNASGTYTVEIEAIDGRGGSASDSFLITVNNANRNPTNPYDLMPTNEMINVSLDTTISWSCSDPDGDPLKYDIYFGISPTPALVASGISNTTYDPGFLEYEQIYYWKVVAVDSHGAKAESSVIHFETKNPSISFARVFGGSDDDRAYCIQQTSDGGYIVAGYTYSNDIDVSGNQGVYDYWVVKLDSSGNIEWQKCFGGSDDDRAYCIQQTSNGGYIVAGYTESNNGDVSGNHGKNDYWIVKLDSSGNIEWQKCLGGYYNDYACSIQQTSNGGYIVAGYTESNNGDVSGNHGSYDYWIVKLDSSGNIRWQKCLGGSGDDRAYSIQQTSDGGYIVTGYTESNDGEVSGNHGSKDYWIVRLD